MELVRAVLPPLLQRLAPLVQVAVEGAWNIKDKLEEITDMMEMINCVLEDAERRALGEGPVRLWMKKLRDVMTEIEDVLDEFEYKRDSHETAWFLNMAKQMVDNFTTANKINDIHKKIEKLHNNMDKFYLKAFMDIQKDRENKQTHSIAWNVVGKKIQENTEDIMRLIMKTSEKDQKIATIAIVGMPGIGKTTLAQNVYSQLKEKVNLFELMCWVSVCKDFNNITLLKSIMERVDVDGNEGISVETLCQNLANVLKDHKKIFMVLDDIWDSDIFDELLGGPLYHAAPGSMILITTRDENVAKKMQAVNIFQVQVLPEADACCLLYKIVFPHGSENEDVEAQSLLEYIGKQIVKKCDFLPLAIKVIGGVLRTKRRSENEWKRILDSNLWDLDDFKDKVMASLYLSYINLEPSHRQCFLYLSLFPNKYELRQDEIVPFWIAEGLIDDDKSEECYDVLVQQNLLLQNHLGSDDSHVMHDIVHAFARNLSSKDYSFGEGDRLEDPKVRRYSILNAKTSVIPSDDKVRNWNNLKSLMLFNCPHIVQVPTKDTIEKMRYLRVLYMKRTSIKVLPEYINKLVLLRLLDLSNTPIESLPESVGRLVNLQYLGLLRCHALKTLPESLTRLTNLRYLDTRFCMDIRSVPKGLGRLTKLQRLTAYSEINELGPLMNLRELQMNNVGKVGREEAVQANLKEKSYLRVLQISCTTPASLSEHPLLHLNHENTEEVLEALCPPQCIEYIKFSDFLGPRLPSWLSSSNDMWLRNLTSLILADLLSVQELPALGELPNLQDLVISYVRGLESIGLEFFYRNGIWRSDARPFRNLKMLYMAKLYFLRKCQWMTASEIFGSSRYDSSRSNMEEGAIAMPFPRLESLYVMECPCLASLWRCFEAASSLTQVFIDDCFSLLAIPELPAVKNMRVQNCYCIIAAGPFCSLEALAWKDTQGKMKGLPEWLGELSSDSAPAAPSLQLLYVETAEPYLIRMLCPDDIGLDWPLIRNIPQVGVFVNHGSNQGDYLRYTRNPFSIEAMLGGRNSPGNPLDLLNPLQPRMEFATSCHPGQLSSGGDAIAGIEVVPVVRVDLEKIIDKFDSGFAIQGSSFPGNVSENDVAEIPFNFHAHLTVITADRKTKVLCIDQFHCDNGPEFLFSGLRARRKGPVRTHSGRHVHLPYTTSTGESGIACFWEKTNGSTESNADMLEVLQVVMRVVEAIGCNMWMVY